MRRIVPVLVLVAATTGCGDVVPAPEQPKTSTASPSQPAAAPPAQTAITPSGTPASGRSSFGPFEEYTPPPFEQQIEQQALTLLSDGNQAAAEGLLANQVKTLPEYGRIVSLVRDGNKNEALKTVEKYAEAYRANQRLLYMDAACRRSRFEIQGALPLFILAAMANEKTAIGQSVFRIIGLDTVPDVRKNPHVCFARLEEILGQYPDEIVVRWMLAVQCRSYRRTVQGIAHYEKILEKWKPGPVLVHQTYGNMLDDLKRYEEALVERRLAVQLEPEGWSYDGLGDTLDNLKRYEEADKAHAKAVELDPDDGYHLGNWAANAFYRKQYDLAIERCKRAVQLAPTYVITWQTWGQCLEAQGKKQEALAKYRKADSLCPKDPEITELLSALEKSLKEESKKKQ